MVFFDFWDDFKNFFWSKYPSNVSKNALTVFSDVFLYFSASVGSGVGMKFQPSFSELVDIVSLYSVKLLIITFLSGEVKSCSVDILL